MNRATVEVRRVAVFAAMAPFLLLAFALGAGEMFSLFPSLPPILAAGFDWLIIGVWAAVSLTGIARGMPRWSLPTIGTLFGIGALFVNGGATLGGVDLTWRINYPSWISFVGQSWIALLGLLALFTLLTAIVPALRPLFRRFRDDWTQLSLMAYGFAPLAMFVVFDEFRYDTPFQVACLLILAAGAWRYLRAGVPWQRELTLLGAVTLMLGLAALGVWLLLPFQGWYGRYSLEAQLMPALNHLLWTSGVLLAPALLGLLPRGRSAAPGTALLNGGSAR